jgi:hypothetical protein
MKKESLGRLIELILLSSFFIYPLSADEYSDFRNLGPEQQIQKLLDDYRYNGQYWGWKFSRLSEILAENAAEVKPVLIEYFKMFDPPMYINYYDTMYTYNERIHDQAFDVIDRIINNQFFLLFNEDEKKELTVIYQEKAKNYVKTYKRIDNLLIYMEISIYHFSNHTASIPALEEGFSKELVVRELQEKYAKLGYTDLDIYHIY